MKKINDNYFGKETKVKLRSLDRESKTNRALACFLEGIKLNRYELEQHGVATFNDSLHSMVNTIQTRKFIPVSRKRGRVTTYFMTPYEINRYLDPKLRVLQRAEVEAIVYQAWTIKIAKRFMKMIESCDERKKLGKSLDKMLVSIMCEINQKLNALLVRTKKAS